MMKVAITGSSQEAKDFNKLLIEQGVNSSLLTEKELPEHGCLVVDFIPASKTRLQFFLASKPKALFLNIPYTTLSEVMGNDFIEFDCFGFNGLAGFARDRSLEVSYRQGQDLNILKQASEALKIVINEISDTIGMVSPRVVCMIINEAYFTFQDGTAKPLDIDLSMRLGTNYPIGPFEWAKKIGLAEVVHLLDRVYDYTHDERYKVCTTLRMEAARLTPQ